MTWLSRSFFSTKEQRPEVWLLLPGNANLYQRRRRDEMRANQTDLPGLLNVLPEWTIIYRQDLWLL